ncbi:hypothetical protein BBJ28_00020181 [Nothophytophthora sp. Chile5]|nr:hypothetical protein BBJ28_00020181 [Nothophytophthora sp. Chile5]
MRPRTKSVVNVREYFRQDGSGAPEQDDDSEDQDDWMAIALRGIKPCGFPSVDKPKGKTRDRASTVDSWEGTDVDTDDDLEEDDDEDVDGILRTRTCSHDRRISFDVEVNVVEIPARSSFDADYKRRVWYSRDELRRSQDCC